MLNRFSVTFEHITPESAEQGDAAARGYLDAYGERVSLDDVPAGAPPRFPLRKALDLLHTLDTEWTESVEADDSRSHLASSVRMIGAPRLSDGTAESLTLHFPRSATSATRARLVRLLCG